MHMLVSFNKFQDSILKFSHIYSSCKDYLEIKIEINKKNLKINQTINKISIEQFGKMNVQFQ